MANELQHHGIIGMKWGRRRFQNSDGSLTAAGKSRYRDSDGGSDNKASARIGSAIDRAKKISTILKPNVKGEKPTSNGLIKPTINESFAERQGKQKSPFDKLKSNPISAHEDYNRAHEKQRVETMSDKDLRDRLNRLQMEKQYNQLSSETVNRGKTFAKKALTVMTTAATVSTTAITLYKNAEQIQKIVEKIAKKGS